MEDQGMARMQELLSSYYGLQDQESREQQLRNIDSPGFDPKIYVKELLEARGLNDLLATDDQLIREVKELDTSMQMLVYENYNKFISATDTIRKMKNNVASMEDEVGRVVASMDTITAKSESINVALAPQRSKVEKLIGVRRLLKRFEFIFELPQRLNTAVKQKEYANATKYYLLARRILGRYEHISSFKTIQVEAEKIIQQLERLLKKRMLDTTLESEEICETVVLLDQLDACNDEIRDQFLEWHQVYFERAVAVYKSQDSADSVLAFLQRFNTEVLTKMGRVFSVYKTHFMPDVVAREKSSASRRSSDVVRDDLLFSFVKELFALYLGECVAQLRRPHEDFGKTEEVLEALNDDHLTADIVDSEYFVFMRVLKLFVSQVEEIDRIIPMCALAANATEIVESCVRFQIEGVFRKLREDTGELFRTSYEDVASLGRSSRDGSQSVQPVAQKAARVLTDKMQQVLHQMEPMVQTGTSILSELSRLFSDLVQGQFYDFLKWFNASALQYAEPKRAFALVDGSFGARGEETNDVAIPWLEPTPQFQLFLACMCHELSAEGIGECVRDLIECLPAPMSPSKTATRDSARSSRMSQQDVTHMIEVTRESSAELLQHVAKQYGNQLCIIVHNGVAATAWSDMDEEPRSVQEMVVAVVEATFRFGKEVALALGDERSALVGNNSRTASRDFRRRASALRSRNGGAVAASSGMQLDVERIFARKIQIFPAQMDLTADVFVQIMLKMCIKAFSEWVRTLELSKFGLQQIQLNAEFLRSTLMHVVEADAGEEEVESLLSDLLSNARARAIEDVLMDQSNVVAIVSTRSTQVVSRRG
ncbi:Vacuolar protein sorting-associated protein 51 [Phytophthora boehmeriae]|uniref:Vacuolar protein sorting-associated protein 51 homolog n=1 Tax=Phytophthora boehmeriae TaxID=109152 RepID=A0A8T1X675_9STRA|nr:Vacuolar protein sorting-associated protein 51 [Phytophthora boehmeriae]